MAAKRARSRKTQAGRGTSQAGTRQVLLLLTVVPMVVGLALVLAAGMGLTLRGLPGQQGLVGAAFALLGFSASNALQGRRLAALGWALLAAAALLVLGWAFVWMRVAAVAVGGGGLVALAWEFRSRLSQSLPKRDRRA